MIHLHRTARPASRRCVVRHALLLLAPLAACEPAVQPSSPAVRDSAGVLIVDNSSFRWKDGRGWRVSERPLLDIGVVEGGPEYQFEDVKAALRLADGRIVVADNGAAELRFYDEAGMYLSTSGGKGGGPGEFEGILMVWRLGDDSLMAWDWRLRRVSVFDSRGRFARSWQLQAPEAASGLALPQAYLGDGSLVAGVLDYSSGAVLDGAVYDTMVYHVVDRDGTFGPPLGRFPWSQRYVERFEGGAFSVSLPFGRRTHAAASGDGFHLGNGDSYEIRYFDSRGSLRRIVRRDRPNPRVTETDIRTLREEWISDERDAGGRQRMRRLLDMMPIAETMPAYGRLVADALGNLWVEVYRRPGDDRPRWTIFDPEGHMLGVVETPDGFVVLDIGADFLLGLWRDDLDVEHIRMYHLLKR